jgi:hypothetical protein
VAAEATGQGRIFGVAVRSEHGKRSAGAGLARKRDLAGSNRIAACGVRVAPTRGLPTEDEGLRSAAPPGGRGLDVNSRAARSRLSEEYVEWREQSVNNSLPNTG